MKRPLVLATALLFFCFSTGCNTPRCKNPQDCYQQGLKLLQSQKKDDAYRYLAKAANDDPVNVTYQWAAANIAPNPKFALSHVKTAWKQGNP